jgi:hypothetical protein
VTILELPFRERPLLELLHLDVDRDLPDRTYAGYGWARAPRIWLDDHEVADVLVLALHSADDGEPMADDIELEFELPDAPPVAALASLFLAKWLPVLPRASAIVLALCNPHHATLAAPAQAGGVPVWYATGDVESWLDLRPDGDRVLLQAAGSWARLIP